MTEMLKGILEGCVLEIISHKEIYGYEITKKLIELGFTDIVEGTIYTILLRFERNNLVNITKKPSIKGPERKFYTLNDLGEKELIEFWQKWRFIETKVKKLKEEK